MSKVEDKPKRIYVLSSNIIPAISGYGGFDEWELELSDFKAEEFFYKLQKLIEKFGGEFTGAE